MPDRWKRKIIFLVLLILADPWLHASGNTLWKVNVGNMGYHTDAERTIVRWRGKYVVIGSVKYTPDPEKNQCIVSFDPKQPLLVFDFIARKHVPADAIGRLEQEWEPPYWRGSPDPCALDKRATFDDSPEALTSDLAYHSEYDKNRFVVLDKNHHEKYRISPNLFSCWSGCITSSRAGNRFALLDTGQTLGKWITNHTIDFLADGVDTDKKRIRVYNAKDGKKLYQVSWVEPKGCCRDRLPLGPRVAFSDDGAMLAFLDDEGVLRVIGISDQ